MGCCPGCPHGGWDWLWPGRWAQVVPCLISTAHRSDILGEQRGGEWGWTPPGSAVLSETSISNKLHPLRPRDTKVLAWKLSSGISEIHPFRQLPRCGPFTSQAQTGNIIWTYPNEESGGHAGYITR